LASAAVNDQRLRRSPRPSHRAQGVPPYAVNLFGRLSKEVSMRLGFSIILRFRAEGTIDPLPERTRACRIETRTVVLPRLRMLKSCWSPLRDCWARSN